METLIIIHCETYKKTQLKAWIICLRRPEEVRSTELYAEHMIEVQYYLKSVHNPYPSYLEYAYIGWMILTIVRN